jgi:hypothetical protein
MVELTEQLLRRVRDAEQPSVKSNPPTLDDSVFLMEPASFETISG